MLYLWDIKIKNTEDDILKFKNMKTRNKLFFFSVLVPILVFTLVPYLNAGAAILIDSSSSANTGSVKSSSLTWIHTVSGSDRILIVGVSINGNTTVSTITYRGQNLTRLATVNQGIQARASLWYLLNPPTGSGSIIVTMSASASFVAGATSYTGVNQSNPLGTPATNNNTGTTATLNITSATNELVVDVIARRGDLTTNPIIAGSGQTQYWNTRTANNNANTGVTGGGSSKAGTGSVTMAWTWPSSRDWAIAGISLKPVLPPSDITPPLRFNELPSDVLPSGTTQAEISLSTDKNATCRYSSSPGINYDSMPYTFQITGGTNHSQEIYGLTDGGTYNFYVRCQDSIGNDNNDDFLINFSIAEAIDTTPPTTPVNLKLISVSSDQVNFEWDASTDNISVIGYKIFRDGAQIASTEEIYYSGIGIVSNTIYSFTVSAYDAAGNESAKSDPLIVTTLSTDTTAPAISHLTVSDITTSSAVISWETDEPSISRVQYGLTVEYSFSTATSELKTNQSFLLDNLSPNATYHYRIRSQDETGNESVSTNNTFQTNTELDITPLNKITDLSVTDVTNSAIDLTWTAPGDNTGAQIFSYDLRYSTSPITEENWSRALSVSGEPFSGAPGESKFYTVVGLVPNTNYYFAIKSSDTSGNISQLSNIVSGKTSSESQSSAATGGVLSTALPLPPSNFEAFPGDGQINFQWKNPAASSFVRVVIIKKMGSAPTSPSDGEKIYEGAGEEYTDINLDNNIVYYYAIYSFNREMNYSNLVVLKVRPQIGISTREIEKQAEIENIEPTEDSKKTDPDSINPIAIKNLFQFNLSLGSFGEDVARLQLFLAKDPTIYPKGLISGYFGDLTKKAVQKFQCKYNIVCDAKNTGFGRVGPKTREKINNLISLDAQNGTALKNSPIFTQTLYLGIKNDEVKRLQKFLSELVSIYPEKLFTGYFGKLTKAAVQRFQCKYNIICSGDEKTTGFGQVGPRTRAKLNTLINKITAVIF